MKDRSTRTIALIWAALMIAVISSTLTMLLGGHPLGRGTTHWVSDSDYEMIERYHRLDEVRDTLMTQFYEPLEEDELMLGAIRGMTAAADDVYTFYYTPDELDKETANEEGRYVGIGVLVGQNAEGVIEILRVFPDSPAEAIGLKVGDLVVAVDGEPIGGQGGHAYGEALNMIRGEENTEVALTVRRGSEVLKFPVMRASVNVSYAEYTMLEDDIGYVSISQFMGDAADRFDEAIAYFKGNGARGMVIDVRNNPGGLLTTVDRIADSILPEGIIVYMEDREGTRTNYYSDEKMYDVPVVVLVNDMSASASELLAASVQALNRGKVVGMTTFGKGIVQTLIHLGGDGAGMQLTTASYFDANGRSIHKTGVTPDVEVALEAERVPVSPDPESDNQLTKALEVLRGEIAEAEAQKEAAAEAEQIQ